ncbi:MAG: hypothetical protein WDK96_02175 [Candidatus Paceibacterota bacterium]|jgi:hypothetical protein
MKNFWTIICLLALATPLAEVITEGNTNTGAIFVTAIVAGIGFLGICMRNAMFPQKTTNIYTGSW